MLLALSVLFLVFASREALSEALVNGSGLYERWLPLVRKYAAIYGVPWRWVFAVMLNESNLGMAPSVARGILFPSDIEGSKSSDGKSWGLMQLTLGTARIHDAGVTEAKLNDPDTSIKLGVAELARLY